MMRRLLIANRGEIAVRIAEGAHRLGIDTVGVYADPDAGAMHTDVVDVAVSLPGSSPNDTYLRGDLLIEAALETGCDAVHPGYGFLAENAEFAQAVMDAGLLWVGPDPDHIRLLGDKVAAKRAAEEAGVETTPAIVVTPGTEPPDDVPMPALVKAAAGGGGRGMRVVRNRSDLAEAIVAASREAESAFGDGSVFVEPFLEKGRHVEVQIIGDRHGNVIHLGERECSIQRRNQKILEEAPSAGITHEMRGTLLRGAVALGRHVGYVGAGTVEFLVGADGAINFLEVNTRLQVEHPVTEAVTGLDLVALQLMVADGEPLPITQDDVTFEGHAIEARVVAEDPSQEWLPSTGTVRSFDIEGDVRVDTGTRAGSQISSDYDSLLAKVIAHGPDRPSAARVLARTLRAARITGVTTNIDTLIAVLSEDEFLAAETPTTYLDDHPAVLDPPGPDGDDRLALLLGAVFATELNDRLADDVTGFAPSGWRNLLTTGQRQLWRDARGEHAVEYVMQGPSAADVWYGPWPQATEDGSLTPDGRRQISVRLFQRSLTGQAVVIDGERRLIGVDLDGNRAHTTGPSGAVTFTRVPRFVAPEFEEAGQGPVSPLPGTVIAVHVTAGQVVQDGEVLMVVEAMKMEHRITAAIPATVADVRYSVGDRVETGDLLVRLEAIARDEDRG